MTSVRTPASVVGRCRPPHIPTSLPCVNRDGSAAQSSPAAGRWAPSTGRSSEAEAVQTWRGKGVFSRFSRQPAPRQPSGASFILNPPANASPPGEHCLRGGLPASSRKHPAHASAASCLPATMPSPERPGSQPCSPWSPLWAVAEVCVCTPLLPIPPHPSSVVKSILPVTMSFY